jgi:hypothetical protein
MISFSTVHRVFIARGHQDMRRGIDTLSLVVKRAFLGSDEKYHPYATCLKTKSCVPSALQARAA